MTLINETGNVNNELNESNKRNEELLSLFKQKIENSIIKDKSIVIIASNDIMECRYTNHIEDFEFTEDHMCLIIENFELHINLDEIKLTYDNSDMYKTDTFIFTYEGMEISIYFLC